MGSSVTETPPLPPQRPRQLVTPVHQCWEDTSHQRSVQQRFTWAEGQVGLQGNWEGGLVGKR